METNREIFKIINEHIAQPSSVSLNHGELDESLFQKLKPPLMESLKRAQENTLDVRAYLQGAVDSMPDGIDKDIYEQAVARFIEGDTSSTKFPKAKSPHYSKLSYVKRRSQKEESDFSDNLLLGTVKKLLAEKKAKKQ